MVAISPQTPSKNAEVRSQNRLGFPVLSDADNDYARSLGLVFSFSDELRRVYDEEFGVHLPTLHRTDTWELPLPTRLVVDPKGILRSIDADPDYTRRPEPEATLEVLRGLGRG